MTDDGGSPPPPPPPPPQPPRDKGKSKVGEPTEISSDEHQSGRYSPDPDSRNNPVDDREMPINLNPRTPKNNPADDREMPINPKRVCVRNNPADDREMPIKPKLRIASEEVNSKGIFLVKNFSEKETKIIETIEFNEDSTDTKYTTSDGLQIQVADTDSLAVFSTKEGNDEVSFEGDITKIMTMLPPESHSKSYLQSKKKQTMGINIHEATLQMNPNLETDQTVLLNLFAQDPQQAWTLKQIELITNIPKGKKKKYELGKDSTRLDPIISTFFRIQ